MQQRSVTVAYADDHTMVREGISSFLNSFSEIKIIIQAGTGKELLRQLEDATELPDVCMIDINMPEMDGFDTTLAIKERWPNIKILILTIFDSELYIIRMITYGAIGYMLKSSDPEELKKALIASCNTGFYYSDANTNTLMQQVRDQKREMPVITPQEALFLEHACSEKSYIEIAEAMGTTTSLLDKYREDLYKKFEMKSRTNLALLAVQLGIVKTEMVNKI